MDIKTLIAVATGKIPHNYRSGICPDELQPDSRDPDCPACKILIEAATEHDAMGCRLRDAEATAAAARDVLAERRRQIDAEGWTPEHDDEHNCQELAMAAACYAGNAGGYVWADGWPGEIVFPWDRSLWKPSTPRRDLVKAAALILAEIERLDRIQPAGGTK